MTEPEAITTNPEPTPPRPVDVIQEQLADLAEVFGKAESFGTPDFATRLALQSLVEHRAELIDELHAAQFAESHADVELVLSGRPVQGTSVAAEVLGDFLKTIQGITLAIAQVLLGQPTSRAPVQRNVAAENTLLVMPQFVPGSFGVRLRFPSKEELGQLFDPTTGEVIPVVRSLLALDIRRPDVLEVLSYSRVKSHYSSLLKLLSDEDVDVSIRTTYSPHAARISVSSQ